MFSTSNFSLLFQKAVFILLKKGYRTN